MTITDQLVLEGLSSKFSVNFKIFLEKNFNSTHLETQSYADLRSSSTGSAFRWGELFPRVNSCPSF